MDKRRDSFFLNKKSKGKPEKSKNKQEQVGGLPTKRQEEFDKNRQGFDDVKQEKKPFDKKTYRLKKYSKKYKLDQWEEQRKKKLLKDYYKEIKNEPTAGSYKPKFFDEDTTDSNEVGKYVRHPDLVDKMNSNEKKKKDPFKRAKEEYNKLKQEKIDKQKEMEKALDERIKKLEEYKKKKIERFKKLSKKNKKGQPVMTRRLEMLLEKIQKG